MGLPAVYWRSLWLRCPVCGKGKLFRGWFRMHERCAECGFKFEREPGYFLGSTYFNYGLTVLLVMGAYLALWFSNVMAPESILVVLAVFSVAFPLFFFRFARSLWMGFDHYFDPTGRGETTLGEMPKADPTATRNDD